MGLVSFLSNLFKPGPDRTIPYDELAAAGAAKTVHVVDVRSPQEFKSGRVPGATNMPVGQFDPNRLPKGKPVVLICLSGARSRAALGMAVRAGREDVRHFAGGMSMWRRQGGKVV